MNSNTIDCPKCHATIEITKALASQLEASIRQELQADIDLRAASLEKDAAKVAQQKAANEKAAAELEAKMKAGIDAGIMAARATIVAEARKQAQNDLSLELTDKSERLQELEAKLKSSQASELSLRKREREMQEKAESLELEVARRIKEESDRVRDLAKKQAADGYELKLKEHQEQISGLLKQIDSMKRQAEQGSQQSQGEALELILEDVLSRAFPHDEVKPVGKGVTGADLTQFVRDTSGLECGSILWEMKNTKKWSPAWLPKLRDDQRSSKAAIAVIVTEAMPPGVDTLTQIDGVWVCNRAAAIGLACALRAGLIELAKSRQAAQGKQGKIERVYDYLTGSEFRQRIAGMVEPIVQLQDELAKERRAMERIWSARDKKLTAAILSMHGMYGDMQGIVGATLPTLEEMDLPRLEGGSGEED